MEFEREMAELDQHSVRLESQISEVQSNRKKILEELKETEEQVKVWEKKIQIEKETQEELQTSKDAIDTKGMEKEIQRMKHRLESLIRTQEHLLRDMELAIHRREDIAIKYHKNTKNQTIGTNQQQEQHQPNNTMTKGELEKRLEREASRLKKLEKSVQDSNRCVENAREELIAMKRVLTETKERYNPVAPTGTRCREEKSSLSSC
jgi:chromosome segregation ATPase